MKHYLLIISITFVACKSLQLYPFLSELHDGIRQRNYQNCQRIPDQSFIGDCIQEGDTMSLQLIAAFRPIAGHEFQRVLDNLDGTYYKQDPNTGLWYIPSQGKSNMIGDGIAKNAESLTHTLDVEFRKLLEAYNRNGLKKRRFAGAAAAAAKEAAKAAAGISRAWPENFKSLNHYELLDVPRDASLEMINRAYKRKALRWHPDRVPPELRDEATVVFQHLNDANTALKDPVFRRDYDSSLNRPRPNGSTQNTNHGQNSNYGQNNARQNANEGSNNAQNNEQKNAGQNAYPGFDPNNARQNANGGSNNAQSNGQNNAGQNAYPGFDPNNAGQNAYPGFDPNNARQNAYPVDPPGFYPHYGQNAYPGFDPNNAHHGQNAYPGFYPHHGQNAYPGFYPNNAHYGQNSNYGQNHARQNPEYNTNTNEAPQTPREEPNEAHQNTDEAAEHDGPNDAASLSQVDEWQYMDKRVVIATVVAGLGGIIFFLSIPIIMTLKRNM